MDSSNYSVQGHADGPIAEINADTNVTEIPDEGVSRSNVSTSQSLVIETILADNSQEEVPDAATLVNPLEIAHSYSGEGDLTHDHALSFPNYSVQGHADGHIAEINADTNVTKIPDEGVSRSNV